MKKVIIAYMAFSFFSTMPQPNAEEAFTYNYEHLWGWNSGSGSWIENTRIYVAFLQLFLQEKNIRSVVDLGCGDWQFSQYIDWKGIDYTGYDVVKLIIDNNLKRFSKPNIKFIYADAIETNLPSADLLICKDVLMHLPFEDIKKFLQQTRKFKYCLITNSVDPRALTCNNVDIPRGGVRPLDLTQPPFCVTGVKILTYQGDGMKQVLLINQKK